MEFVVFDVNLLYLMFVGFLVIFVVLEEYLFIEDVVVWDIMGVIGFLLNSVMVEMRLNFEEVVFYKLVLVDFILLVLIVVGKDFLSLYVL